MQFRIAEMSLRGAASLVLVLILWTCAMPAVAQTFPAESRISASVVRTIRPPDPDRLRMPTAVATDSHDRLYVADGAQNRIVRLLPDGRVDLVLNTLGGLPLSRPTGVHVDSSEQLWIADTGNRRILCVNADGNLLRNLAVPRLEGSRQPGPTDAVPSADGRRLYVVDKDNHRILIHTFETGAWTAMGSMGEGHGRFQWPFMLAIAPDANVYITDVIGAHVHRITSDGRWAGEVSSFGVEAGQVYRPKGVTTDKDGRLFVSDSSLGVVQVFQPDGTPLGVLCSDDGKPLRFEHPMGLCTERLGRLCVVELLADRIAIVQVSSSRQFTTTAPTTP